MKESSYDTIYNQALKGNHHVYEKPNWSIRFDLECSWKLTVKNMESLSGNKSVCCK